MRAWKLTAAAVLLAAAIPTTVWAQASPPVVVPGGSVVLDRQQAALAVTRVARGTAGFVPSKAAPAVNQLVYVAPDTPGDDTVEYTVGGTEKKSVTVSVRQAAPDFTSPELYGKSFAALFMLFIMAVLVENGLALLFHWRPFLVTLDPKSVNPLVSFGLSLVFVRLFHQDIVSGLLNIYSGSHDARSETWPGLILTAMIVAGGSGVVNRLFQAFGLRTPLSEQTLVQRPPLGKGWLSVVLPRSTAAVGRVDVLFGTSGPAAAGTPAVAALTVVGTIDASARDWGRLGALFARSQRRFPPSGGHPIAMGTVFSVQLRGKNRDGRQLAATWGPYTMSEGAVIDLVLDAVETAATQ